MKLNALINSCQNQWLNVFTRNKQFKVILFFGQESYTLNADYTNDKYYMYKYRDRNIIWWEIKDKNTLLIEMEGNK